MADTHLPRIAGWGLRILLMLGIALGSAEALIRILHPAPRRNIVRASMVGELYELEGIPLWSDPGRGAELADLDCPTDGAFRIMVLGDSIFNGMTLPANQLATGVLATGLRERWPDRRFCVSNLAISGFSPIQSAARGRSRLTEFAPHLVLFELWGGPPRTPVRIDDTVYVFDGVPVDDDGVANLLGLPTGMSAGLLRVSSLYAYAAAAWPDQRTFDEAFDLSAHHPMLDDMKARVEAGGGELVAVLPSYLNRPFDDQPEALQFEHAGYLAWAASRDVPVVKLWEELAHLDSATLGMDGVHFNVAGHAAVGEVLLEVVAPRVERWAP